MFFGHSTQLAGYCFLNQRSNPSPQQQKHIVLTTGVCVQSLSYVCNPWTAAHQASLSFTISCSLLKFMFIESFMLSNHLILHCPFLLLPSVFPSIRVFSNELPLLIRWPKYWSFSFSISPSNEYSGLISSSVDWFDLLAVQRTLKNLLQHHNLKISILWHSAFFINQLSHPYMTTGKIIASSIQTFVGIKFPILFHLCPNLTGCALICLHK